MGGVSGRFSGRLVCRIFFGRGWSEGFWCFCKGVLGKCGVWRWCFDGEVVVRCVVDVVF